MTDKTLFDVQGASPETLAAIGQFSAKIAHDFNNLFAAINGCVELMKIRLDRLPDGNPVARQLQVLEASITRGTSITSRLRGWVRQGPIQTAVKDLSGIIESVVELIKSSGVVKADIEVTIQSKAQVEVNDFLLSQSLMALCMNAAEAMSKLEDRTLLLFVTDENTALQGKPVVPAVRISVVDHGVGITEEKKRKLFEPFFTTKSGVVGEAMGLSMAMTKELVRRLGGELEVRSLPDLGSSISIILPAVV